MHNIAHTYTYAHINIYLHTHFLHTHVLNTYIYLHTSITTDTNIYLTHINIYAHLHTHKNIYLHSQTYTYTHNLYKSGTRLQDSTSRRTLFGVYRFAPQLKH